MLPKKCWAAETSIRLGFLYPKEGIKRVKTEDKYRCYSLTSLLHDPLANPIPSFNHLPLKPQALGLESCSIEWRRGDVFLLLAVWHQHYKGDIIFQCFFPPIATRHKAKLTAKWVKLPGRYWTGACVVGLEKRDWGSWKVHIVDIDTVFHHILQNRNVLNYNPKKMPGCFSFYHLHWGFAIPYFMTCFACGNDVVYLCVQKHQVQVTRVLTFH